MNDATRAVLRAVAESGLNYVKAARAQRDEDFGAAIQKEAAETVDALIAADVADPVARDKMIAALVNDKSAAMKGLRNMCKRAEYTSLGETSSIPPVSSKVETADEVWARCWSFSR